ncbi:glycosyltransferase family 2 protein [Piromyces sp. E2]|nr:glycosyltransferase family 2 protein [Piromyces sp. E2]|eukprot:OUM63093.1 glycosyltransferase family 2 protein [Piromyces sp. E2]
MPTYNAVEFLDRSINSVLNQTLKEIELIIINDASTDNTTDILNKYQKKDPRITIINRGKNGGPSVTRNNGIEIATGEFIGFHDCDDTADSKYFENLYKYSKNYDVVEGMFLSCTNLSDNCLHHIKYQPQGSIYDSIWRRSFLNEHNVRFGEKKMGEDAQFRQDCYKHKPRRYEVPDVGIYYYYKRRSGSLMNFSDKYLEHLNKEAYDQKGKEQAKVEKAKAKAKVKEEKEKAKQEKEKAKAKAKEEKEKAKQEKAKAKGN